MKLAIRLARQSLRSHKLRSRLSTLGVVTSVFLVSLVFIISDSVKANLRQQANQLANDAIVINGRQANSVFNAKMTLPSATLSNNDVKYVEEITNSDNITSNLFINGSLGFDGRQLGNATVIATSAFEPAELKVEMLDGDWFDKNEQSKKWIILGEDLANRLIGTTEVRSQVVDFKGEKFTVIGIIKKVGQPLSIMGYNIDNSAVMSLTNGQSITNSHELSQIIATNIDDLNEAKRGIAQALGNDHVDSSDYTINTSAELADQLSDLVSFITIVACSLSAIILVISCISIANIMLVNIVERKHEIGIRKAVGATTRNIMGQFIAESMIMSLRGGVVGIILAYIVAAIILLFFSINLTFSWLALGIGFIIPIIIGVIAGIYPAYKASKQDIISALNQLT